MIQTWAERWSRFETGAGEKLMVKTEAETMIVAEPGTGAGCKT